MAKRVYRDQQFKVRVTKKQLEVFQEAAALEGLTPTEWARSLLLKAAAEATETPLRGNTEKSKPLTRSSDREGGGVNGTAAASTERGWQKKRRRAAKRADGRSSDGTTDVALGVAPRHRRVAA